jgi:hypothetical protein
VEKVKLEVGRFGGREEKIRSKIDDVNSRRINVGSRDA